MTLLTQAVSFLRQQLKALGLQKARRQQAESFLQYLLGSRLFRTKQESLNHPIQLQKVY
jgi:hypothetical protein